MLAQGPGYPHLEDLQPRDAAGTPNFPRSVSSLSADRQASQHISNKSVGVGSVWTRQASDSNAAAAGALGAGYIARLCASALFMAPGDHELELQ